MMKNKSWVKVAKASADPTRAQHFHSLLSATSAGPVLEHADSEQLRILAAVFSGAQVLGGHLVSHPDWLNLLETELLRFPRRKQGIAGEVERWLAKCLQNRAYDDACRKLWEFKQMEMLRIAARDLARLAPLPEILQELSSVADVCLDALWRLSMAQMVERHGRPMHQDAKGQWRQTNACILGMGKLGGQELNYSSDVDLLFVYTEEGGVFKTTPGPDRASRPVLSNHQFFNKAAELFISLVTGMRADALMYRVDMRLRPEGEASPLTRSLESYENYYAQWGQTWERMMLIKARPVAGDQGLGAEFLETVQPFRYPRSINSSVLREIGAMKDRIETEVVKSGELDRNVKLGRGGIREIEFIAQSQQLLHGGKQPFLQGSQTLPCLEKLAQYELLPAKEVRELQDAYRFLRDVEHRLQMEQDLQTHTVPADAPARLRLARLCDFPKAGSFDAALRKHREQVRGVFERVFARDEKSSSPNEALPADFQGSESVWLELLTSRGFKDAPKALKMLKEFVDGPGYVHVSPRTVSLARQLIPKLFTLCPGASPGAPARISKPDQSRPPLSDPDRVLTRLDSFLAAYGARSTLFELWHSNATIFELLALLFDRSEFLAELAIRTPDLVDELVGSDRLRVRKSAEDTLRDLRHGLADEDQYAWLRRYHQAELMRIGLRDILGLAGVEQTLAELSALAEACLQYALEVVMHRHQLASPPFTIVGLGKLGGAEIDYGSDLDILFVAGTKARDLPRLSRLALEVMDLISKRTELGIVFQTDSRLRPDGEKGLLVNTLKACTEYWRERAMLWEIQSLSRARAVAGDVTLGQQIETVLAEICSFSRPQPDLAAYTSDWRQKIHAMRLRIEKERTPQGKEALAIKTGAGGLMDAEFVAQAICLEHGWHEPNTMRALERARMANILPKAEKLIASYQELRRIEAVLRRWSYEGETVLPEDDAPYARVSVRCGYSSPAAFGNALAEHRGAIRSAYLGYFGREGNAPSTT